jgi:hypothetical protein
MLTKVANGEMTLGIGADNVETSITPGAEQAAEPKRIFSRKRMRGF